MSSLAILISSVSDSTVSSLASVFSGTGFSVSDLAVLESRSPDSRSIVTGSSDAISFDSETVVTASFGLSLVVSSFAAGAGGFVLATLPVAGISLWRVLTVARVVFGSKNSATLSKGRTKGSLALW